MIKVEMHFLPDVYVPCDVCGGSRYNRETLEVQYKGRNIAEVLRHDGRAAFDFFSAVPMIARKLQTLLDVGPGLHPARPERDHAVRRRGAAGQAVAGAVQARHRPHALHPGRADHRPALPRHRLLLKVIHALRDHGNTVVVIEHNLDVIKTADWIIDLGPEGGAGGGEIVAEGPLETICGTPRRATPASTCAKLLERSPADAPAKSPPRQRGARSRR